MNFYG
jgi:hypothetical protein